MALEAVPVQRAFGIDPPPTTNPRSSHLDIKAQTLEPAEEGDDAAPYNKEFGSSPDDKTVLEAEAIPLESHPELHSSSLQPSSVDDKENEKNFPTTSKTCLEIQSSGIIDQTDGDTSLRHASSSTSPVSPALSSSSAFTIPNYTKTISKSASSLYLPRGRKSFVYVGFMREHPIPPSLETEWVKVIRVRLVKDLIPVVQGLPRTLCRKDKVIEPELCMAGELKKGSQDVHLKPTVWIRCGSKKCREKVKAAVDDLSYLRSFSRGTVQVGLHAPRAAGKDSEESENGSYYEQQNEMTLIVEQISNSSSACGLRLQILTSNYEKITTRFATIGGLIQVNGAVYGLTTAHSLIPEKAFDNDETGISSDARSEESESDLESLATSTESFARAEKAPQDNSIYTGATIRIGDPRLGPFSFASSGTDIVGSDFALIELGIGLGAHDFLRNEYILDNAGDVPPIQINTWEGKDDEPFVGQVHIICAFQDVREGFLLKEKSLFIQEGAVFHTRKIQMSQPLAPGSSGSWVVHRNTLLGYMTAVYDSEPYAHMIPIHDALAHIQKAVPCEKLPPIPHVSLPGGRGTMTVPAPVSPDLSELDAASVRLTAPRSPISPEHEDLTLAHQSTIHKRLKKAGQHRSHTSVDTFRSHNSAESDKWWEDIDNYSPSIPQGAHENNPPISWSIRSNLQELRLRHGIIDDEGRHPRHSQDRKMNGKRRRLFKDKYAKGWRKLLPSSVRESQFFSSTFCYTSRNSKTFVARAWPAISLAFGLTWIIPVVVVLRINFTSHIVGPSIGCLQSSKKCHLDLRSTQIQQAKPLAKDDQNILVGLQIAAKVLDAWFCSIAASLVWSILKKLAGHDSTRPLPIGYLHIPTECSEMAILPKLFWGRRRDVTRLEGWSKMRLYIFIIFVTCVCILCNLMGPAAAVLVIPSLQWTNINQAQEVWFESMLSTQGPQHSVIIPGCSQDTLEAGNYSCTGVLHSAAVDSFVAAATGPDDPIQNLNNGIAWKQTSSFSPILQDENISFTINFSNPTIWIPSRQILHGISADLDNFDATTMTGGPSSEGHPNPGLFMRSIQSPSRQILHGISTDMDDFNDKTMKGGPSRQILHDKTMKGGLSRQILHGISTDMDDSNDKTMKGGLSPGGYPDSGLFTRSLQSRLQRHGPIFGQQNSCFKTDLSTDIPVGTNRTVRCFGNTDITGVAKCIPQGAGWTNINQAFSNFTIHAIQSSSSVSLIDVSIYTTSSSLYISDPDMRCIKSPTCTSGLDWNAIFLSSQIPQHQNVSGPQQTFVYTRAPESPADGTLIWCDLQTTVAFADYILDPNPITNRIKFVETTTQTPTSNQPLFVHSDWTLAAWSVDSGSSVRGPRGAARKLNAAMESWIANEGASQAPIDFKFIHQFMAIQTLSMIPYNTTIFKPSNTTSNPPLSRKAMVQVWKYGVNSRSSIFGVVVLTLGLICVLARAVLYDKEPTLDATDILIKALKGTSTLLKTNSLSNSSTLLPQDDSGEESEKEKEKDFPVLEIDQTLCARRVSYRRGISFHG